MTQRRHRLRHGVSALPSWWRKVCYNLYVCCILLDFRIANFMPLMSNPFMSLLVSGSSIAIKLHCTAWFSCSCSLHWPCSLTSVQYQLMAMGYMLQSLRRFVRVLEERVDLWQASASIIGHASMLCKPLTTLAITSQCIVVILLAYL